MESIELKNIKYGDIVFNVINKGTTGIQKYQYIGIHIDMEGIKKHIFISEYFLSTTTIEVSREETSRYLKQLHFKELDAIKYKKSLVD